MLIRTVFCISTAIFFNALVALEPVDESAINRVIQDYTHSWNEKEGNGFADHYSEQADFVNIFGMKFCGKTEIENRHTTILQGLLKGSKLETLETTYREVQPGLVIATVFWKLNGFRTPGSDLKLPGEVREGVFTHVLVQTNGKWEITASQNTLKP